MTFGFSLSIRQLIKCPIDNLIQIINPLQSYLQTVIISKDMSMITSAEFATLKEVSDRTNKAAQVFLAMLPIICVYPFLQKYFTKGIVMGSVKG